MVEDQVSSVIQSSVILTYAYIFFHLTLKAVDRVHRIGQTRPVSVFQVTVKGTVEDRILALQERKRGLVNGALGGTSVAQSRLRYVICK